MELIKFDSSKTDYYLRSNSECTGIAYNASSSTGEYKSFSNAKLNEKFEFDTTGETATVYILFYSNINADNMGELQGNLTRVVPEGRLLATDYSGTTLYVADKEMDDEFNTSGTLEWYWILLIVLAALLLIVLLIFLIVCCCCGKDDEPEDTYQEPQERNVGRTNTTDSSSSLYKDDFIEPVKGKMSDGKVKQYFTDDGTERPSGFTNDL